ncbi:hypothetical protein FA13DRAFT_1777039 [Coprinellus micaceus]|uniref:Uncharacterized protein n=1 Tax=Coprinellus micaceus TaxID=71717 RepID=A0A4Y7SWE0_COPMI|nr:hypothetical protein FA13DRAFT_1777039 [Coprinellus micaceus]
MPRPQETQANAKRPTRNKRGGPMWTHKLVPSPPPLRVVLADTQMGWGSANGDGTYEKGKAELKRRVRNIPWNGDDVPGLRNMAAGRSARRMEMYTLQSDDLPEGAEMASSKVTISYELLEREGCLPSCPNSNITTYQFPENEVGHENLNNGTVNTRAGKRACNVTIPSVAKRPISHPAKPERHSSEGHPIRARSWRNAKWKMVLTIERSAGPHSLCFVPIPKWQRHDRNFAGEEGLHWNQPEETDLTGLEWDMYMGQDINTEVNRKVGGTWNFR